VLCGVCENICASESEGVGERGRQSAQESGRHGKIVNGILRKMDNERV